MTWRETSAIGTLLVRQLPLPRAHGRDKSSERATRMRPCIRGVGRLFCPVVGRGVLFALTLASLARPPRCRDRFHQLCNPDGDLAKNVCIRCGNSYDYDCERCQCQIKAGLLAAWIILGLFLVVLVVVGICCFCRCCPWYQHRRLARAARELGRSRENAERDAMLEMLSPDPRTDKKRTLWAD